MAVAFDAATNLGSGTGDRNFNHTPSGTPAGVLVIIIDTVDTDQVVGVTYGGDAMTQVPLSPRNTGTAETGSVHAFFLGTSIPTGTQSVAIDRADSTSYAAVCYTVTAGADTEVHDTSTDSGIKANPSATLTITQESFVAGGLKSGQNALTGITPGTGLATSGAGFQEIDFGTHVCGFSYATATKTTDFAYGWTQASEDSALLAVAITEIAASGVTGDGALTVQLAGSGSADVRVAADGAATVNLSAAAEASVQIQGDGALTVQVAGAADGSVLVSADGAGSVQVGAAGSGTVADPSITGDGALTIQVAAAADGSAPISGDGAATVQITTAADGSVLVQGDGAATVQIAAEADGGVVVAARGRGDIPTSEWVTFTGTPSYDSGTGEWTLNDGDAIMSPLVMVRRHWSLAGEFWTDGASPTLTPQGGMLWTSEYFQADGVTSATNIAGWPSNGNAQPVDLNTWTATDWEFQDGGGNDVVFCRFRIYNDATYVGGDLKVRNVAIYSSDTWPIPDQARPTIQLSGAGDGSVLVQGDGAGTVQVSAAGDGTVSSGPLITGDGALTVNVSGAGDAGVLVQGDGALTIQIGQASAGDYADVVALDNPVAWWRLEETTGATTAVDSGQSPAADMTVNQGSDLVFGEDGIDGSDAIRFNPTVGFDGYLSTASVPSKLQLSSYTLEAWVKLPTGTTQGSTIFSERTGDGDIRYWLGFAGNLKPQFGQAIFFNNNETITAPDDISLDEWHHLVGTHSGSALQLWVDGEMVVEDTSVSAVPSGTAPLQIGRRWDNAALEYFIGWIDEVAIYNGVLADDRIVAHYEAGVGAAHDVEVLVSGDGALTLQLASVADGSTLISGDGSGIIQLSAAGTGTRVRLAGDTLTGAWYAQWRRANTPSGRRRPSRKSNW